LVRRGLFHAQHSAALNTVMNDAATGSSHAEKWKYLLKEQAYTSFEESNEPEGGVNVAKGHMIWMLIASLPYALGIVIVALTAQVGLYLTQLVVIASVAWSAMWVSTGYEEDLQVWTSKVYLAWTLVAWGALCVIFYVADWSGAANVAAGFAVTSTMPLWMAGKQIVAPDESWTKPSVW
jgi:hypothetical protein